VTPLIRRYIKTSFVFLLPGVLLGGYIVIAEFVVGSYPSQLLITAHVHLLLVGFLLMIVMGVATWMSPRPGKDDTHYRPGLAEAVYWTMMLATAVRAAAEITSTLWAWPAFRLAIAAGGLGQLVGTGLFVMNMWWRVRMPSGRRAALSGVHGRLASRTASWPCRARSMDVARMRASCGK
jgi:hypothetical protein